jgi:hypothetical protein
MTVQNTMARDGYSREQLAMVLESVVIQVVALNGLLQVAQTCHEDEDRSRLVDAAQVLAQSIGCFADNAVGDDIFGNMGRWHCGPFFAAAGKKGGAA